MANRRIIGGMGNRSGNRSFSQQPFQGNVNPWQGNMSNSLNQGLMNQLSNPQQLALALTSLLQPQQQPMHNPPSLLSLNAAPAYQDRDIGRFGNRGRSNFRRPEPYNKNNRGDNWRDQGNRNRNRNQGGGGNKARETVPKKLEEKKKTDKKPCETVDLSLDEGDNEKKREWKEEKNKSEDKNKEDEKDAEMKEDSSAEDEIKRAKEKEGRYSGIPQHLLHCFVCSKDMWDGESFQKHVRGRAHKQMLDSLEESMGITVGILRENMRLAEEKKMIELNRMQRLNKKPSRKYSDIESHCNMCDFKFLGKIMAHRKVKPKHQSKRWSQTAKRKANFCIAAVDKYPSQKFTTRIETKNRSKLPPKSEGHQRLKRFLHPNCNLCDKEFPSRMEWVDHRLSPEHLRELAKFMEDNSKGSGAVVEKDEEVEFDLEPLMEEVTEQEDDFPIVELDDDLHDLQNRIPAYRKTRLLGSKSLIPFTGFLCEICNSSFTTDEAGQAHLKSKKHYLKFVEAAKNKYQKQLQDEKDKEKAEKEKKDEDQKKADEDEVEEEKSDTEEIDNTQENVNDSEMYDPEEAGTEDEKDKEDSKQNGDISVTDTIELDNSSAAETKEESPVEQSTPSRPKRGSASNVKNGAGPKSKKTKK